MKRTKEQLIDHLYKMSTFRATTNCLLWNGCKAGRGYGVIGWEGKQAYIHRVVYQLEHPNEVLDVVRHTCDTPNCWNIEHLINGTTAENIADKVSKKRHIYGSEIHNSALTEDDVLKIRSSPLNLYQLANLYKVTPSTIHYVRARKTWKHVL